MIDFEQDSSTFHLQKTTSLVFINNSNQHAQQKSTKIATEREYYVRIENNRLQGQFFGPCTTESVYSCRMTSAPENRILSLGPSALPRKRSSSRCRFAADIDCSAAKRLTIPVEPERRPTIYGADDLLMSVPAPFDRGFQNFRVICNSP